MHLDTLYILYKTCLKSQNMGLVVCEVQLPSHTHSSTPYQYNTQQFADFTPANSYTLFNRSLQKYNILFRLLVVHIVPVVGVETWQ